MGGSVNDDLASDDDKEPTSDDSLLPAYLFGTRIERDQPADTVDQGNKDGEEETFPGRQGGGGGEEEEDMIIAATIDNEEALPAPLSPWNKNAKQKKFIPDGRPELFYPSDVGRANPQEVAVFDSPSPEDNTGLESTSG